VPLQTDTVGERMMFSGCPSAAFVNSFVRTDLVTMISCERLNNLDETYREYSLAPTDDLVRFGRPKLKGQGHSRLSRWRRSTSTLGRRSHLVVFLILKMPSVMVVGIAGLSSETVDRLMDYVEKYLMVRLYRIMFCSYLTDDEERDLAMQNRIRSLHWITSHLLDTALDETIDAVRDLLDSAITGVFA